MNSLYQEQFKKIVVPKFKKEFGLKNELAVPHITKVVINTGIGRLLNKSSNKKEITKLVANELALITGQKPAVRPARKSISSFKIRQGMPVGMQVTLRGRRMGDFIYKFVNIVLPRIRDFWGIPLKKIDKQGNLNYGIREHTVFPEVSKEERSINLNLEVTFVTDTKNRDKAIALFRGLGFPIQK